MVRGSVLACFLAIAVAFALSTTTLRAETKHNCDVRIETEFRQVLKTAAETLDFRPLGVSFGPGSEELRGLNCHPEVMRSILEDAGFKVYMTTSDEDGRTHLIEHLPSSNLLVRLRRRISAMAEVIMSDGEIVWTSIGPTKYFVI